MYTDIYKCKVLIYKCKLMVARARGAVMQGQQMCTVPVLLGVMPTKEANGKRHGYGALLLPLRTAPRARATIYGLTINCFRHGKSFDICIIFFFR